MDHQTTEPGNLVKVIPGCYLSDTHRKDDPAMVVVPKSTLGVILDKTPGRNLIQLQTESLSRIFASEMAISKIAEDTEND